jgi:hypothetical protein
VKHYSLKRFYLDLSMNDLKDDQREQLVAGILQVAPTSVLVQKSPAMQASVAALAAKASTFKAAREATFADQQKLSADIDAENVARAEVDLELLTLGGLVATGAKSEAEVTGAGYQLRPPPPPKPPFAPPAALDIRFPAKQKGLFVVSPHVIGKTRSHWVVQKSVDPIGEGTWVEVVGAGKSRTLTGPSGSKVWVRYAMVRGAEQSAWGTPVLVTFP